MSKQERKRVAGVLLEWAAWCEATPRGAWDTLFWARLELGGTRAYMAAQPWCSSSIWANFSGPTAATGLCLAAAMVEAGDSL